MIKSATLHVKYSISRYLSSGRSLYTDVYELKLTICYQKYDSNYYYVIAEVTTRIDR